MLIIACSFALLVIYAGTKLLVQTRLNALGQLYRFIARALIIMGFLLVVASFGYLIACCYHHGGAFMRTGHPPLAPATHQCSHHPAGGHDKPGMMGDEHGKCCHHKCCCEEHE